MTRLVVVANRLPLTIHRAGARWQADRSSGGLVAALDPVVRRTGGIWVGWPGDAPEGDPAGRAEELARWERELGLVTVDIPSGVGHAFYEGYANSTLWPLLHGFQARAAFDPETFRAYRDANERFAAVVCGRMRPDDDLVWIQDYQLMLLPALVRAAHPGARLGFFLHVPFPGPETFRVLPERAAILEGLLGADVLGFQTHEHLGAFRRTLQQVLGIESRMDGVEVDGRLVALEARPIGIDPAPWEALAGSPAVRRRVAEIRGAGDRKTLLAVDRLDDTKGIPERLRAFREFLGRYPGWRGRVTLIQVAVPTRERVPRYAALRREVNELVGEINGALATAEWNPVVYLRRSIPQAELAALYAAADVCWVGSLRDGMNLVAKEYVACQGDAAGVLLLSEFAGAASEMGEAIRINPYDEAGTAEALSRALDLPDEDRAERQAALLGRVRRNSAFAWAERSIADLERVSRQEATPAVRLGEPSPTAMAAAFDAAATRGCYLDYDGTLVPIARRPVDARPGPDLVPVLRGLVAREATTVLVVSGRPARDLEGWFGAIDGLWLAAEHGALIRSPATRAWEPLRPAISVDWKPRVRPILEYFLDQAPGSVIEEKAYSLAWHYRLVEPEFGAWLSGNVAAALEEQVAGTGLSVLRGRKVLEVRLAWATKSEAVAHLRAVVGRPAFELAAGDDRTDEDLFELLGGDAWTIKVGSGATRARSRVAAPGAVLALLAALAAGSPG
jgi:trehalose 6-phosphate synthase/phosphatase